MSAVMVEVLVIFGLVGWLFLTFLESLSRLPFFPAIVTAAVLCPVLEQPRLFESEPDLEIARTFFETRAYPARAILLGRAKTPAAASYSLLQHPQCVRLV